MSELYAIGWRAAGPPRQWVWSVFPSLGPAVRVARGYAAFDGGGRCRTLDVRTGEDIGTAVRTRRRPRQPHVDRELRTAAQTLPRHRLTTRRIHRRKMRPQQPAAAHLSTATRSTSPVRTFPAARVHDDVHRLDLGLLHEPRRVRGIVRLEQEAALNGVDHADQTFTGDEMHVDLVAVPHPAPRRDDGDHGRSVRRKHRVAADPDSVGSGDPGTPADGGEGMWESTAVEAAARVYHVRAATTDGGQRTMYRAWRTGPVARSSHSHRTFASPRRLKRRKPRRRQSLVHRHGCSVYGIHRRLSGPDRRGRHVQRARRERSAPGVRSVSC